MKGLGGNGVRSGTRRTRILGASFGVASIAIGAGVAIAGGPAFQIPIPIDTDTRPIDIAIGKLGQGSTKDIAVANRDGGSVSVS
jgi:hypothetical protein